MSYYKNSKRQSREFADAVNQLVIAGVSPSVAMNIVRWRQRHVKPKGGPKNYLYDLGLEKCLGPSVRLAEKVKNGTNKNAWMGLDQCFSLDGWTVNPFDNHEANWQNVMIDDCEGRFIDGTYWPNKDLAFAHESVLGLPCVIEEE